MQQQHIGVVEQPVIHSFRVLFPERTIIKGCTDDCPCVDILVSPYPGKTRIIASLEELAENDRPQLLKSLGKIAFEITREVFALTIFDCVAAKFDNWKVF